MHSIDEYASDHLFLLVGANPVPNYVAARLLVRPGGELHLLHTGEGGDLGTTPVAICLQHMLKEAIPRIKLHTIHDADDALIVATINEICSEILKQNKNPRVGLNYTGGTKPMAVHTYRAIAEHFPKASFSYLDPRRLALRVDRLGAHSERSFFVLDDDELRTRTALTLQALAQLHGYMLTSIRTQPRLAPLYRALAAVHATQEGIAAWRGGQEKGAKPGWLRQGTLTSLPSVQEYPALAPVIAVFGEIAGNPPRTPELAVAQYIGFDELECCRAWLDGGWLEEYALDALNRVAEANRHVGTCGANLKSKPDPKWQKGGNGDEAADPFELDVAAMLGYQLYGISCIVSAKTGGNTKTHLLEAFVRVRQLGGDEARAALICCVDSPEKLRKQVAREWDAEGKIQVFGRKHLPQLAEHLQKWMAQASLPRKDATT